jgi:excisionase family DNA binding protein
MIKLNTQSETSAPSAGALSVSGFCGAYNIGRTTAYEEIKARRLRAVKAGNRTLILRRDADAWAEALPALRVPA